MRLFLDERALTLPADDVVRTRGIIEALLEVVDASRPFEDERISRSDLVYDQQVRPGISLSDFLYTPNPEPALADARKRLGIALDRMTNWEEEGTPDAFEVELDGQAVQAPTLAWAWAHRRDGQAVACLAFSSAGRSGARSVVLAGAVQEIYVVAGPEERVAFLRASIVTEKLSAETFPARAVRAFPTLLWREGVMGELRSHKASFFDERLASTVLHLAVLDDHGAAIFQAETEQKTRITYLGAHGVDASSENHIARSFTKAIKDHTRIWRGAAVQFWWHTKLTFNDGRIHFLHEPPAPSVDPAHPHGRIVVGIFADHLLVSGIYA